MSINSHYSEKKVSSRCEYFRFSIIHFRIEIEKLLDTHFIYKLFHIDVQIFQ